jgi:hypothetical protein
MPARGDRPRRGDAELVCSGPAVRMASARGPGRTAFGGFSPDSPAAGEASPLRRCDHPPDSDVAERFDFRVPARVPARVRGPQRVTGHGPHLHSAAAAAIYGPGRRRAACARTPIIRVAQRAGPAALAAAARPAPRPWLLASRYAQVAARRPDLADLNRCDSTSPYREAPHPPTPRPCRGSLESGLAEAPGPGRGAPKRSASGAGRGALVSAP